MLIRLLHKWHTAVASNGRGAGFKSGREYFLNFFIFYRRPMTTSSEFMPKMKSGSAILWKMRNRSKLFDLQVTGNSDKLGCF